MKKAFLSIILLVFTIPAVAQKNSFTKDTNSNKVVIEALKTKIPNFMKEADVPGMAVALIRNGKLVWTNGFGVKNADTQEAVSNDTIFEAASLSKPVVAYATLKLVDQGKIDLDVPLNKYLGNNYDVGDDKRLDMITARRVLSHSSGFPNWRRPQNSKILPINFTPGEKFSYSGEGFVYLSKVIEKITNMKFEDFIRKMVFEPLKMDASSFVWQDEYEKLKVFNHNAIGKVTNRRKDDQPNAAASLHTTAEDYSKFVIAVLKGKGLKDKTHQSMLTPQIKVNKEKAPQLSWGLGIGLQEDENGKSFWHWGDNGNNKSFIIASTKNKNAILFFTNGANGLSFLQEILNDGIGGEHQAVQWLDYERYDSPARILLKDIVNINADAALNNYDKRRKTDDTNTLSESQMNRLGYNLIYLKKIDEAIIVFEKNAKDFPKSANVWDSLAESHMVKGNKELAIKYYEKSLELNPENKNAVEQIKKLKSN
jgi:CubicO group peptidase (beta-lactamase class C family)